jgi:hypothetical protein
MSALNKFKTTRYDVTHASIVIVDSESAEFSRETHALIYIGRKLAKGSNGKKVEVINLSRKVGYTHVSNDYFQNEYENKNDIWRDNVARRLSSYSHGTGQNDFFEIDYILVVPRGALGEPISTDGTGDFIVDKEIHKKLHNIVAIDLGNDLMDFDFENKMYQVDKTDPTAVSKYAKDCVVELYNKDPNGIELDLAQALQIARITHSLDQYLATGNSKPFKALLFDAPRTGKTLLATYMAIVEFCQKRGFRTVVLANWVLTANTSFELEQGKWIETSHDLVNFMDKNCREVDMSKSIQWANVSLHGKLDTWKKTYSFLDALPGPVLVIADEFDEGSHNLNQKEKLEYLLTLGKTYA